MKKYMESLSGKKIIKDQSLLRHEDIRHKIRVLPELQSFIPPLLPDELNQLEENIRKDGCREALLVWETTEGVLSSTEDTNAVYVLVDGHNRFGICQRNSLDFRVNLVSFSGLEEVRNFMIDNQLGRRNLTPEQTAYFRGLRYLNERGERGKYNRDQHKGQNVPYGTTALANSPETASTGLSPSKRENTAQKLAKQYNVNEKTIKRDAEFAAGVEKLAGPLKAEVLAGRSTLNKTSIQQLAKSDVADGSVTSLESFPLPAPVDSSTRPTESASKPEQGKKRPGGVQPDALRKQLRTLIEQLSASPGDETALCDEIIDCAARLKAAISTPE